MLSIGRLVSEQEARNLIYYFDSNGNGTVEFEEFKRGVERLVGSSCPHGSGIEYLSQQSASRSIYIGDFHDDKRHGCGLFKAPSGWGYLGWWRLGVQNGGGFEVHVPSRNLVADACVPMLVSYVKMDK